MVTTATARKKSKATDEEKARNFVINMQFMSQVRDINAGLAAIEGEKILSSEDKNLLTEYFQGEKKALYRILCSRVGRTLFGIY